MLWFRQPGCRVERLCFSGEGRPLLAMTLGTGKRHILAAAGYHANEYLTTLALWGALESLTVPSDAALTAVPCVNPDGVAVVLGLGKAAEYAALGGTPPEAWKADLQGVDLNLNFPAAWEQVRARKPKQPGARDYPGQAPLSQPETRAMAALTETLQPEALLCLHSQGQELYAAYGGTVPDPLLAKRLSQASGYPLREVPASATGGGHRDWFLETTGRPGFTAELGLGENPLPLSQLPALTETVRRLLETLLESL